MAYDRSGVTLLYVDAYSRRKTKQVQLVSVDPAQAETDALLVASTYANVTVGGIIKATIRGDIDLAGVAGAGSNIDTGVTVTCQLADRPEKASNKWPMPDPAIINPDGTLDLTNAEVIAVENLYVTPGNIALLSDGEAIDGFISGRLDK
jgi:hypothetical protein